VSEKAAMRVIMQRPFDIPTPLAISAEGIFITLADGRKIIDADGGAAVACLGHGDPRVIDAMIRQARKLDYAWSGAYSSEAAEALAELLLTDEPGGLSHAFFTSSGSEAIEAALKLARQYFVETGEPGRCHFIGRRQSFHGVTLGALSLSGHKARRAKFEPLLASGFSHVSPCFSYHDQHPGEDDTAYVARLGHELELEFQRVGPSRVAAFVAETVVGATCGAVPAVPGYFETVSQICRKHGALLILDEIMCGMGRTGLPHSWMAEGIAPDIQTIGKSLAAGYQPLSAVLATNAIVDGLRMGDKQFAHVHTYQSHPIACAAALAVQEIIREESLIDNVQSMGSRLRRGLRERLKDRRGIGDIRGRGLLVGIEFVADRESRRPFDPSLAIWAQVRSAAFNHGLSVFAASGTVDGTNGDHVMIAPAFNIDANTVDRIIDLVSRASIEVAQKQFAT
jgi:adenosylmethionine-8-amino-7-oxononanoate aminotransferase